MIIMSGNSKVELGQPRLSINISRFVSRLGVSQITNTAKGVVQ